LANVTFTITKNTEFNSNQKTVISFPRAGVGMQWATRQRCGKGTLARPDGIPTPARGNEIENT